MAKSIEFVYSLQSYAYEYIDECLTNTTEVVSGSGKLVKKLDRHIPTIDFFLMIWIPKNYSKQDTIKRSSWYRWIKWDNTIKQRVIDEINELFKALASDIVANEGKGIFYAKNKLNWTDKQQMEQTGNATIIMLGEGKRPNEITA
jgi:hypothetical protein